MNSCILAELASQHHLSDYNRLRYGLQGSPIRYSPLSTTFPAQFQHLQLRQLQIAELHTAWFIASQASQHAAAEHLSTQLRAAMDEPLTPQSTNIRVKTSMTHPINISCLVPPESLSLIASQASLASLASPVLLEVPPQLSLQNITNSATLSPPMGTVAPRLRPSMSLPPASTDLSAALQAAISATLPSTPTGDHSDQAPAASAPSSPLSLSLSVQIPGRDTPITVESSLQIISVEELKLETPPCITIGNLFMSSCPGKKVRMNGPVNGRSAVCRDVSTDMARMKSFGIGCIICCLDDEELALLGASWPVYLESAQALGIDVLRLPIPEGLPPATPAYLDLHLGKLLREYTLKGVHVLVHCRGGVGRAGVVACCWLMRLGLCGWISEYEENIKRNFTACHSHRQRTVSFVDTVIRFVRKRRNPKAVETFEQVQFLVDYVEFLQGKHLD